MIQLQHQTKSQRFSERHQPNQFKEFQKLLERINELKCARTSHVTDMAETTNLLKNTVVMAEDSRILGDMSATRKIYSDLYALTFDLFLSFQDAITYATVKFHKLNKQLQFEQQFDSKFSTTRIESSGTNAILTRDQSCNSSCSINAYGSREKICCLCMPCVSERLSVR